jgi:hypothetical protein
MTQMPDLHQEFLSAGRQYGRHRRRVLRQRRQCGLRHATTLVQGKINQRDQSGRVIVAQYHAQLRLGLGDALRPDQVRRRTDQPQAWQVVAMLDGRFQRDQCRFQEVAGKEAAKGLRRSNTSLSQRADRSTSPKAISDNLATSQCSYSARNVGHRLRGRPAAFSLRCHG